MHTQSSELFVSGVWVVYFEVFGWGKCVFGVELRGVLVCVVGTVSVLQGLVLTLAVENDLMCRHSSLNKSRITQIACLTQ